MPSPVAGPNNAEAPHEPECTVDELKPWYRRAFTPHRLRVAAWIVGAPMFLGALLLLVSYYHYAHLIDARLKEGPFRDSVNIYAGPLSLSVGDQLMPDDLV